jgi:hypothetical protein
VEQGCPDTNVSADIKTQVGLTYADELVATMLCVLVVVLQVLHLRIEL